MGNVIRDASGSIFYDKEMLALLPSPIELRIAGGL
jgi:hypothetical protein